VTWLSGVMAQWKAEPAVRARLARIARYTLPFAMVVALVFAAVLAWSYRNHLSRGYFGFAAMVSASDLQGEFLCGTLDPRVLIPRERYQAHAREGSADHTAWHIYGDLLAQAQSEGFGERGQIRRVEQLYDELYRASNAQMPPPARFVKFLRSGWFNLRMIEMRDYIGSWKPAAYDFWVCSETFEDPR